MCKIKKGEDITADMEYFFPIDDEVSKYHDSLLFNQEEEDSRDYIESPRMVRTPRSPKRHKPLYSPRIGKRNADRKVKSDKKKKYSRDSDTQLTFSQENTERGSQKSKLKKHFQALKFSDTTQKV